MATPFGRYKFLRLPLGLSSSPEAYQQMMVELFGDLIGVEVYFDDFLCGVKQLKNIIRDWNKLIHINSRELMLRVAT
jgi:hypothetical protein